MGIRFNGKDGKEYEIMTAREARGRTDRPLQFHSIAEADAMVKQILATPEGEAKLHQLLVELEYGETDH